MAVLLWTIGLFSTIIAIPQDLHASVIPEDRLPPSGMFHAGISGGIPANYTEFCDVTDHIPGSQIRALRDGVNDDSGAINAALDRCPAGQFVFLPAGTYRISDTIRFPARAVVLRGAGSQSDAARTNLLCYGTGAAVSMNGKLRFGGWLSTIRDGFSIGSKVLTFSSRLETFSLSAGDILVVAEDCDPQLGTTVGGRLESLAGRLPAARFQWTASHSAQGAYYVSASGGADPKIAEAKIRQVFYSPNPGVEAILARAHSSSLTPSEWTFGNQDSLGFSTLYVRLPGDVNPASLPPVGTDGAPEGGVWYNSGIAWGGTYLSAKGLYAHNGQGFKVVSRSGTTVTLDRPFYWSFKGNAITAILYTPGGTGMGLEDLCIQVMQAKPSNDAVVVQNTTDSWVKNVEVKNASKNFIVATNTIDCEFRHNYVHEPWDSQGGSGYGIRMLGWNFNNLVEDNIAYSCRHSYVMDGINTGHVFGYNLSLDPNNNTNGRLPAVGNDGYLYQDFLTHGSNPCFCLYEGNVGARAYCDFVHGSANNLVFFRNHFRLHEGHILSYVFYKGSETVDFDRWNDYMTVVGNILGYPAMQADQMARNGRPMEYEGSYRAIYRLGYNADDNARVVSDTTPKATLLRHGNFDYVNNAVVWDPAIPDHHLPDSYYLNGKPAWFGNLRWPATEPTNAPTSEEMSLLPTIPAMERFLNAPHPAPTH